MNTKDQSVIVCCQDMLADLTGVNDAFEYGFWWDDNDSEPLRLHEWLSDKEGDTREIKACSYCQGVPLQRPSRGARRAPLQHRPGDDPQVRIDLIRAERR